MPAEMLSVMSPYDGRTVAQVPRDDDDAVGRKLEAACQTARKWARLSLDERGGEIRRGLDYFRQQAEPIAADVSAQMGKPIRQARREVETLLERAEQSLCDAAGALQTDVLPAKPGFVRRIEHAPLGIVLNIAAWNYPLIIPINVVVPALLAGNVVLLKHSAKTPLTGQAFERAFASATVPHLLTNLVLDHGQTARLIADRRIDHVAFTGSVEGGRQIHLAAAQRLVGSGLELGGKDAAYVAADADLDFAAENIVDGACYNAGQSCCAVERVYVHESLCDDFLLKAAHWLKQYRLGDPADEQTTMGPLADAKSPEKLALQVQDASARGGRLVAGGGRPDRLPGHFFEPTLLADVPNDALAMQEESFGPLCPVAAVRSDQEAIERINDSRFGLTASVWTDDPERAESLARELIAGTIYQNRCDFLDPMLPWTGWRESGLGSTLSRYGFYHLTRRKSIHFRRR